jgi:thioredoxin reductase (NADPH)
MTDITNDLVIIGGGPAGLTAGLYSSRALLKTKLIEKLSPGGQVLNTDWVENYPGFPEGVSGFELVDRMRDQALRFGLVVENGEVVSLAKEGDLIRINLASGSETAKAVIITTGAEPVKLGIPGELELMGKGVSYCATCDGPFYRDEEVVVVGGGDTAVEEAIFLTRFASKIHLCHRRDELRATGILKERVLKEDKIEIHWSTVATSIEAGENNQVNGVTLKDLKTGKESIQPATGAFMFVGNQPITSYLKGFLDLSERGYIITDQEMATSVPGVWAAGDVRLKKLRQIATAVGEGASAAFNAEKYIEDNFS